MMIVAPLPIVALLVLVQRVVVAIRTVIRVVIGVVNDHFMIVPAVIVVVVLVVIPACPRNPTREGSPRSQHQQTRKFSQLAHDVKPPEFCI